MPPKGCSAARTSHAPINRRARVVVLVVLVLVLVVVMLMLLLMLVVERAREQQIPSRLGSAECKIVGAAA